MRVGRATSLRDMSEEERAGPSPTPIRPQLGAVRDKGKIAMVCSLTSSLVNFRFDLIKRMVESGHNVVAFGPESDGRTIEKLQEIGVRFVRFPMERVGLNPLRDLQTCFSLYFHFRRERPQIVFSYTMKPVIYASIIARLTRVPRCFALISGFGYVFTERARLSWRERWLKGLSRRLYRLALRSVDRTIVYNEADRRTLLDAAFVDDPSALSLVPGSGVNLDRFTPSTASTDPVTFLMIARLLKDKGLYEYFAAARRLKKTHPEVRVQLLGPLDPNPSSVTPADVDAWAEEGVIDYLGATDDVRPYLRNCSVYVLPSYREGLSRTILEAMASGRAVITSDAPGCADAIDPEETGLIVPVRDAEALYQAMARLAGEPSMIARMGRQARRVAEKRFDVHAVNDQLMDLLDHP